MNNDSILVVRNIEQAAAWLELDGQISDGHWENSSPHEHWVPWYHARVVVAQDEQQVGRNFHTRKDTYNFTNIDLLKVVGLRMLGIIRIARRFGIETASLFEHSVECDASFEVPTYEGERYDEIRARVYDLGLENIQAALADESYTFDAMKRDLVDLKTIVKTKIDAIVVRTEVAGIVKEELRYGARAEAIASEQERARELRTRKNTERYGKMFADVNETEEQFLAIKGSSVDEVINRAKLSHRMEQADKGCKLIEAAALLRDCMDDLVSSLKERGINALPNSLGEVQGKGADVDRLCAEFALLRSLGGGSR